MKLRSIVPYIVVVVTISCATKKDSQENINRDVEHEIKSLTQHLDEVEGNEQLTECLNHYTPSAISMPEYQTTLSGSQEIENYYRTIFEKQHIKNIRREPKEFIHLGKTIVVIGTYKRDYEAEDSIINLDGKYLHVWTSEASTYRIKGEAFGYFHPVDNPKSLIISTDQQQPDESEIQVEVPFQLKAYNALMEKGVRQRNATIRVGFFSDNAIFYPHADSAIVGMDQLKPYLTAYSNRGTITINSVTCYTYNFEKLDDYILEYDMFKVSWSRAGDAGRTEGKGIRLWKRETDGSLKLFREIGTHNYL